MIFSPDRSLIRTGIYPNFPFPLAHQAYTNSAEGQFYQNYDFKDYGENEYVINREAENAPIVDFKAYAYDRRSDAGSNLPVRAASLDDGSDDLTVPPSGSASIDPNQISVQKPIDAKILSMLQEQFIIAHNKLEKENQQERFKMLQEIDTLKDELRNKQDNFEKSSFELRMKNLEKVMPLDDDIERNRLSSRSIIVPIVTNSSVCRLDEDHHRSVEEGYDEEHETEVI